MNKPKKIPVYLVTGFLGAGKTTFINQLLEFWSEKKVLVVENEVGEISFDSGILKQAFQIQEFSNGCLCCVLADDWLEHLEEIVDLDPDLVLIEASGAADPSGILSPFFQIPQLQDHFNFQQTFALVDVLNFEMSSELTDLHAKQLALADTFILSRTELISEDLKNEIKDKLKNINALARIFDQEFKNRPLEIIIENPIFLSVKKFDKQQHDVFQAHLIEIEHELDFLLFQNWINMIMKMSNSVYRIKGILKFQGFTKDLLFQAAGKYFSFEEVENIDKKYKNQMVWIGKNLQVEAIQKQITKFYRK